MWSSNVSCWRQDYGCKCLLGMPPCGCQSAALCRMGSIQLFVWLGFALFGFQRFLTGSSNMNSKPNSKSIPFWCAKLVIHSRKDKASPKNNTLPILSETPSTSIFQAVQFKCTSEIGEVEIPLPNSLQDQREALLLHLQFFEEPCSLMYFPQSRTFVPKETDTSAYLKHLSSHSH